jgi:hypothetical protein
VSEIKTGPAGAMMARMRVKCIARYRLRQRDAGHPEELVQIGSAQGMSIVYGCFDIRVRLHHDYRWLAHADFSTSEGLTEAKIKRLFDILDPHFGWTSRGFPTPDAVGPVDPKLAALYRPPIGGLDVDHVSGPNRLLRADVA